MQAFYLGFLGLRPRSVRLSEASEVAEGAPGFRGKHELCRRIRRLAAKDRKARAAPLFERLLRDTELAVMVRLEAARALGRQRPARASAAVAQVLASAGEIPALKSALRELAARWSAQDAGRVPMPAVTAERS
jgi:hypothetical protein